ncbi:hypothetical protein [Paenibacillus sp. FSL F4-0100]
MGRKGGESRGNQNNND